MERFADDFAAVIAELCPGTPVHVLAHDWGLGRGVGVPAPTGGRRADRVVHFGVGSQLRPLRARPSATDWPGRTGPCGSCARRGSACGSDYRIPFLAARAHARRDARRGFARRLQAVDSPGAPKYRGDTFDADAVNSLKIYRANALRTLSGGRRDHCLSVPVQVACGTGDPVVRAYGRPAPRGAGSHTPTGSTSPTPSNASPTRSARRTVCPTSSSTTQASGTPGGS